MAPDINNVNGVEMADIASINGQDAPSGGGGTATTAPSVSVSGGGFGAVTATITKSGGGTYTNPNYSLVSKLADGTVTVADADVNRTMETDQYHQSNVLKLNDTNAASGTRTISVRAQEFGDTIQSSIVTATYDISYIQNKYIRVALCDTSGNVVNGNFAVYDCAFFTGSGQSGTEYPTTTLTSNTSETGIAVSTGGFYSNYDAFNAFNGFTSWYWALSQTAANSYIQLEFEDATYSTKPIIKSMMIRQFSVYMELTGQFLVTGSNNADMSSPDFSQIFDYPVGSNPLNVG